MKGCLSCSSFYNAPRPRSMSLNSRGRIFRDQSVVIHFEIVTSLSNLGTMEQMIRVRSRHIWYRRCRNCNLLSMEETPLKTVSIISSCASDSFALLSDNIEFVGYRISRIYETLVKKACNSIRLEIVVFFHFHPTHRRRTVNCS